MLYKLLDALIFFGINRILYLSTVPVYLSIYKYLSVHLSVYLSIHLLLSIFLLLSSDAVFMRFIQDQSVLHRMLYLTN